jgi:hypothetical protein
MKTYVVVLYEREEFDDGDGYIDVIDNLNVLYCGKDKKVAEEIYENKKKEYFFYKLTFQEWEDGKFIQSLSYE